jgi:hypothetical protein
LGRVRFAHPRDAGFNETLGIGAEQEAYRLALGKGGIGLQAQAVRRKVNGIREVFRLVTLDYKSHSHLDPPALRPGLNRMNVIGHGIRIHG